MKIAPDKWRHFWVGIPLGVLFQFIFMYLYPGEMYFPALMALVAVTAIAYGFELFSLVTGKGHYDFWDAVASVIGGVFGVGGAMIGYVVMF